MRSILSRGWHSITEPRRLKVTFALIYAGVLAMGIVALIYPPSVIDGELGDILSGCWAAFFIVGSAAGLGAVLPGWWWVERLGIYAILAGCLIYLGVVVSIDLHSPRTDITEIGLSLLAAFLFFPLRWSTIRKYSYEPRPDRITAWT